MNQPTINLVIDKSNQNMVLPFLSKETSIDKMLTNVGEIIYIKNGMAIIEYDDSFLFLKYDERLPLHEGSKVKLNFTDNLKNAKTNIQMKLLGEFFKNEININIKFLQNSNCNIIRIYDRNITNTQKLRIVNWLNDFLSEFDKKCNDLMFDKFQKDDINSCGLFVKKVLEKLINSIYLNSFTFPSPTEIAKKITNYIKFFLFNEQDYTSENNSFKKFIEDETQDIQEGIIRQKKININKEKISFENIKIDKNIDSYLKIKNLVNQEQHTVIFTIIFNLPIYLHIDQDYNQDSYKKNNEHVYKFSIVLLTKKFGVVESNINLINNTIYITFELEKNKEYFLSKIPDLKQSLLENKFNIENINVL